MGAGLLASCGGSAREPLLTYFSDEHRLSIRYPASWRVESATQDSVWYRHFIPPTAVGQSKPLAATLLVAPVDAGSAVDDYAQRYLAGSHVTASRDEQRQGIHGRSYVLTSDDGTTRSRLLLLKDGAKVYGLHGQGETLAFSRIEARLEEMFESLTFENPDRYVAFENRDFRVRIRTPRSWPESRRFSGGKSLMVQFTSPALVADKSGQTAHASLTLTVEPLEADASLESFYNDTRLKLGDAFELLSHKPWRDGYVDLLTAETPLTVSRVKRFYRVSDGRGYGLAFEAREDVLPKASRWCDLIAATLQVGDETR
jgi:hypothetical protein